MSISAQAVKELRERTGAGMMECKKALSETSGDMEAAVELMRKTGQAKAAKKAGRVAAEGVITISVSDDKKSAAMVELNSETDFVAREGDFLAFAKELADVVLANHIDSVAKLSETLLANGQTVDEKRATLVAKIGENIQVRRVAYLNTAGVLGGYSHGVRIGVLVALTGDDEALARDIAMHVAASRPEVVKPEEVDQATIEKEKEIFKAQALESGKPPEIVDKMIGGRIQKFLNEISLHGQPFVKDPNQTVLQLLQAKNVDVERFVRLEVGEGIEKEIVDFAEEVKAQAARK